MIGAFVLWAWTRQLAMDPNLLALTNSPFLPGPRNLSTLLRPALWRRIPADHPQSSCSSTPSSGTSLLSARSGFNWRTTLTVRAKKGARKVSRSNGELLRWPDRHSDSLASLTLFLIFITEETEYEYSGSDEDDENRSDDRESRYSVWFRCGHLKNCWTLFLCKITCIRTFDPSWFNLIPTLQKP